MNILFACGGTAGHINPALAIASKFNRSIPDSKILFVGTGRVLEKTLIPQAGYQLVNIKMTGLRRGFAPKDIIYNIKTAINIITASHKTSKLIKEFKPSVVVGTGGYICYPVLRTAAKHKIPTVIHESNAVPGKTTKILSSIVDKVLVSFPNQEKLYKRPERVVLTGTPIREEFKSNLISDSSFKKSANSLVVSFWGSLGAERMNEVIAEVIKCNIDSMSSNNGLSYARERGFDHVHAAGKKDGVADIKKRLSDIGVKNPAELPPGIEIREYIEDMPALMAAADLVICRGGGSTVAELMEMSKPCIIIPSPYVANNEQEYNAQILKKADGAIVLDEKKCTGKELFDTITALISDKGKLDKMSENLKKITVPNATENVVKIILSLCIDSEQSAANKKRRA